jgi:hypothetical protein
MDLPVRLSGQTGGRSAVSSSAPAEAAEKFDAKYMSKKVTPGLDKAAVDRRRVSPKNQFTNQ